MKKKLVISIVSIMSFILLLSGILIFNNKEVKNSSVDKEIKSENQEDTTWQEDYEYKKDKKNKILVLGKYNGKDKDITIPAKAVIDGVEYRVMTLGVFGYDMKVFDDIDSLTVEDGVMFPTHDYFYTKTNTKKLKIGKVDLSMFDFFNVRAYDFIQASEEIDLTNFDNTSMVRLTASNLNATSYMYAPKIILGKKNVLLKKWNGLDTKIEFCSDKRSVCYWLREGTNEVYSSKTLPYQYDGETMSGTYLKYDGDILLKYNPNGGVGYVINRKMDSTTKVEENKFERYGYTFNGWNTESDGSGTSYNINDTINSDETITLYAQWIKNDINLETKTLRLDYHLSEEDSELFATPTLMGYSIKLKINDEAYNEKIVVKYGENEKLISSNNGIYNFYTKRSCNYSGVNACAGDIIYDGPVEVKLPENVEYEISPLNTYGGNNEFVYDTINGKLTEDKEYNIEIRVPRVDLKIYFLTEDPLNVPGKGVKIISYNSDILNDKIMELQYNGTKTGTYKIGRNSTTNTIYLEDGDFITVHNFPTAAAVNVHTADIPYTSYTPGNIYNNYELGFSDYSGGIYSQNPSSYTFIYKYKEFSEIRVYKSNGVGVENKKYKFKITAKYNDPERYFKGKIVYTIKNRNSEIVENGKIEFNENGVGYFEIKPTETITIGKKYNDYEIHNDEELIPYVDYRDNILEYTIEEIVDKNKYYQPLPITYNYTTTSYFYNYRNKCSLKFTKFLKLNFDKIKYSDIKDYMPISISENYKNNALNYYFNNNEVTMDEMNSLTENKKEKIYDDYLKIYRQNYENDFLNILHNKYKFKFKLSLKDEALHYAQAFGVSPYNQNFFKIDNYKYDQTNGKTEAFFTISPTFISNDEQYGMTYINFDNLWCGMEYEIEELDNDKYDLIENNTKGILKHDGTSYYNKPVLNEASITNIEKKGTLTLNKKIKGNVSKDEEFKFDITLKLSDKDETKYTYTGSKEGTLEFVDGKASITLKGGESIKLENLPFGIEYKVVENTKGYKVKKENDTGTIDKETVVTFINSKDVLSEVNTLDGIGKYIIVAIVSVIGIVTTIFIRKHSLER